MKFKIGDIVEIDRNYPYIKISKFRGIVFRITVGNDGLLLWVRFSPSILVRSRRNANKLVVNEHDARKVF